MQDDGEDLGDECGSAEIVNLSTYNECKAARLEGKYPEKTLALMYGAVPPEPSESFFNVLEKYADFKTSGYGATDHRLRLKFNQNTVPIFRGSNFGMMSFTSQVFQHDCIASAKINVGIITASHLDGTT